MSLPRLPRLVAATALALVSLHERGALGFQAQATWTGQVTSIAVDEAGKPSRTMFVLTGPSGTVEVRFADTALKPETGASVR